MGEGGKERGREGAREGGQRYLVIRVVYEGPHDGLALVLGLLHLEHEAVELLLQFFCRSRQGGRECGREGGGPG